MNEGERADELATSSRFHRSGRLKNFYRTYIIWKGLMFGGCLVGGGYFRIFMTFNFFFFFRAHDKSPGHEENTEL